MIHKQQGKLLHLEGLRGLAAYGVFLVHFLDGYSVDGLRWAKFGQDFNVYVALFFILSGRILTASTFRSRKLGSIAVSILKRPWRLGLPLVAVTALHALVLKIRHNQNYNFLQIFFEPWHFIVYNGTVNDPIPGVAWTMPHEFLGSMVVYMTTLLILYFDSKRSNVIIFSILLAFTIFTHTWISHFLVGLMFSVFKDDLRFLKVKRGSEGWIKALTFKTLLCGSVFMFCFDSPLGIGKGFSEFLKSIQYNSDGSLGVTNYYWEESVNVMIISSTMMLILETTPILQRFLSNWPFLYLARISFMMYLTHEFLYCNSATRAFWVEATPFMHQHAFGKFVYLIFLSFLCFISSDFFTIWIDGTTLDFTNFLVHTVLTETWDISSVLSSWTIWPIIISRFIGKKAFHTFDTYRRYFNWKNYD